jgi:signal peptidase I
MKLKVKTSVFVLTGILIAVLVMGDARYFWLLPGISIRSFQMVGSSMLPAIKEGDRVLVSRLYYLGHKPRRGDVILLQRPGEPNRWYIKRVAALSREKLEIKGSQLIIDNREIKKTWKTYLESKGQTEPALNHQIYLVPEDTVFVLGDNLDNSADSRVFGPINFKDIHGKMIWKF